MKNGEWESHGANLLLEGPDWRSEPEPEAPLKFVCAWCQVEQGIKSSAGESHGICKLHYELMLARMKKALP